MAGAPLPKGLRVALLIFGVVLMGMGIWALADQPTTPDLPEPSGSLPTGGVAIGTQVTPFNVRLLDGGTFSLTEHFAHDGRPVLLNFWASWCIPCRAEMPALDAAATANPDIAFLGIATDDTETAATRFAEEVAVGYPLAIDTTGLISEDLASFGLPSTYAIDTDGTVRAVAYGEVDADRIDDLLDAIR